LSVYQNDVNFVLPLQLMTLKPNFMACSVCYGPVSVCLTVIRRCSIKVAKDFIVQTTPHELYE